MTSSAATNKPRQIPLDLPWPRYNRATRADFISSGSNAQALGFLKHAARWPDNRLALVGPEGCGKTHLAMVWALENDASFADRTTDVRDIAASGRVILEDCDRWLITQESEAFLFHLLNILREEGGSILMTARTPPARWPVRLPDLLSRLSAVTMARIKEPDDDLLEKLVTKLFADRDIVIRKRLSKYIARRIERRSAAVEAAVAALDAHSIEHGEPVSVSMAKEVFGW